MCAIKQEAVCDMFYPPRDDENVRYSMGDPDKR